MKSYLFIIIVFSTFFSSCNNQRVKRSLLPGVSGKAGEVMIIMDKSEWQGENGVLIKNLLLQNSIGLPQSEPIFNPVNIPKKAFSELFRIHRNIIITKFNKNVKEASVKVDYDVWAQPQTVIYLVAPNKKQVYKLISDNSDKILGLLFKSERDRLMANYKKYSEKRVMEKLQKSMGIKMTIPKGYTYDLDTNNFVWISHETPEISQGLFIYSYPFVDDSTFTLDFLVKRRDSILKLYVSGESKGTFMTTEKQVDPIFKSYNRKGKYTAEIRGLWKVHGDFMGGPFVSISRVNYYDNMVYTIEGYVYAPKYDKRNYVRQLEAILYSAKFN